MSATPAQCDRTGHRGQDPPRTEDANRFSISQTFTVVVLVLVASLDGSLAVGFQNEPKGPHRFAMEVHRHTATSPSLLAQEGEPIIPLQPRDPSTSPTATVFGFLPYWSSSEFLRYELLTHIACAAVDINADGSIGNSHGWPWTGLINNAHQAGVRIQVVAALFDGTDLLTLLTTPAYRQNFFVNIHNKMLEGSADGLNIDFEGSGLAWKAQMPGFMAELTDYLHTVQPGCEVTIDGPAVNWSNAWDLNALAASCDGIFIMGYDFYGSWSTTTGPVAPLLSGSININNTVRVQYASVVETSPKKLILGVPYYAAHWTTLSSAPRSTVTGWVGHPRFSTAQVDSQLYGLQWEAQSQTPWYRWSDGSTWHQVWFDNASSLGLKYDLAMSANFQGVGIWALGYDGDRPELWEALESRFMESPAQAIPTLGRTGMVVMTAILAATGAYTIRRSLYTVQKRG